MYFDRLKPSTKARREGYAKMHGLKRLLLKLLAPNATHVAWREFDHWLEEEFGKDGWRDYMYRHIPTKKRGGPSEQK